MKTNIHIKRAIRIRKKLKKSNTDNTDNNNNLKVQNESFNQNNTRYSMF